MKNLVQVGSQMWLDPENIVGVRWVEGSDPVINKHTGETVIKGYPGYTQVIHRDDSSFMSHTAFLTSDWPFERVMSALHLVSADDLDGML